MRFVKLHRFVAGTRNHVELLFAGQVNELDSVAGHTNREVRIFRFFRVFHCIDQLFRTENVDIEMVGTAFEITVHHTHQIVDAFFKRMAESVGANGLRVGDAVQSVFIGKLSHRIQRGKQTVLFRAVAGVSTRRERLAGLAAIRKIARCLTVYNVRRNRQNRSGRFGVAVRMELAKGSRLRFRNQ